MRSTRPPGPVCDPRGVDSSFEWKQYYTDERTRLGTAALLALIEEAQPLELRAGGALIVPHTRIEVTGRQIATAVSTVLASGVDRVLALGVLHGARRSDQARVSAARNGDRVARDELRRVHNEDGMATEEFSLDGFVAMLGLATERAHRRIDVVRRYPFLVGDEPASLPGIDELEDLVAAGAMLVATTDPIHHGHGYGTPPTDCLDPAAAGTLAAARSAIDDQLAALADHRFDDFAALAEQHRSDFRDTGPVTAQLMGRRLAPEVHDLVLVDYAEVLGQPAPTWVAGALISL